MEQAEIAKTTVCGAILTGLLVAAFVSPRSVADPAGGTGSDRVTARQAFDRLKTLEGTWHGEGGTVGGETVPVTHEFEIMAGGTAVVEVMDPDGEREVNVYHLDGVDLLMTHYCGGGTQPTLRLVAGSTEPDSLSFLFVRATNMPDPTRRHVHGATLVFRGPDRIESRWSFHKEGRETATSEFLLTRAARSQGRKGD